jgi:hypothetical protein
MSVDAVVSFPPWIPPPPPLIKALSPWKSCRIGWTRLSRYLEAKDGHASFRASFLRFAGTRFVDERGGAEGRVWVGNFPDKQDFAC